MLGHGRDPKRDRVLSLLGTTTEGWDVVELGLSSRVRALIADTDMLVISRAIHEPPTLGVRRVLTSALVERSQPADIACLVESHPGIVSDILSEAPALIEDRAAWRGISAKAAFFLLRVPQRVSFEAIVSSSEEGHIGTVLDVFGPPLVFRAIAHAGTFALAEKMFRSGSPFLIADAGEDRRILLLRAALWPATDTADVLVTALEEERERADEIWLRAAVTAVVAPTLDPSDVLPVVFGPMHDAITADRLPRDCWNLLDHVLPPAPDPALRLRRYLIATAEDADWSSEIFRRALRRRGSVHRRATSRLPSRGPKGRGGLVDNGSQGGYSSSDRYFRSVERRATHRP